MSTRKRKADDELPDLPADRMSSSPSPSPAVRHITAPRNTKRPRTNVIGRPLALPRLLETLTPEEMRSVLQNICERHPEVAAEIVSTAPRPSVQSALNVLGSYEASLRESFPYGDRPTSEYAYNRVRPALQNLIDALKDFTPHFLPPNEQQPSTSLAFLNGATDIIAGLPEWDSYQHNRHKDDAYEEIGKAWALVIREAAKKGGGIHVQYGGWDQKLVKHNQISGGKLQEAVNEMQVSLGYAEPSSALQDQQQEQQQQQQQQPMSIRDQLLSGTYGTNQPVQVGPWRY